RSGEWHAHGTGRLPVHRFGQPAGAAGAGIAHGHGGHQSRVRVLARSALRRRRGLRLWQRMRRRGPRRLPPTQIRSPVSGPRRHGATHFAMNTAPTPSAQALVLDYGGVICLTAFERIPLIERKLGLPPGAIPWRGPFDAEADDLWRDMLADRISEREYWRRRAAEVGRLVGQDWTEARALMMQGQDDRPEATTRPEALAAVRAACAAGRRVGVL